MKTDNIDAKTENEKPELQTTDPKPPHKTVDPTQATDNASLDVISADLVSSMSDVQNHAIELEETKQIESTSQYSHLVDKNGTPFDPNLHKVKKDGEPTISKTGILMLKPIVKKKGITEQGPNNTTLNSGQVVETTQELSDQEKQQCVALGKISANALFSLGRMLGGEEWTPSKSGGYDEAAAMEAAFSEYYISSGKTEISPAMGLTIAIGAYAAPRFVMPETQKKGKSFGKKVFAWWNKRKGAKEANAHIKAEQIRKDSEKKETVILEA